LPFFATAMTQRRRPFDGPMSLVMTTVTTLAATMNHQPSRVGSRDMQTSKNGADKGGTIKDRTICILMNNPDSKPAVKSDCLDKVINERPHEHKRDPAAGNLGLHAIDPVPELSGYETPREGIGNQYQGNTEVHRAFNSQFHAEQSLV
jgi:hypothetical protein